MKTDEKIEPQPTEKPSGFIACLQAITEIRFTGLVQQLTSIWAGVIGLAGVIFGAILLSPVGGEMPDLCAFYNGTSLPCPGCGLTRSVTSYFHGEFVMGFLYHPLGIGFAILFVFCGITLFLPVRIKKALRAKLSPVEQTLGRLIMLFVIGMFLYGILRIVFVSQNMAGYEWWKHHETPEFAIHWVADQQPSSKTGEVEFSLIKSSSDSSADN